MWQRFTDSSKKVVFYAQQEAERAGVSFVDTEHLLLGFLRDSKGAAGIWPPPPSIRVDSATMAGCLLTALGLSHDALWEEITHRMTVNDGPHEFKDMKLSALSKSVISLTYDEARRLRNNYIGVEHLLLGLVREEKGIAGQVLAELGVTVERARQEVWTLQGHQEEVPPPPMRSFRLWRGR